MGIGWPLAIQSLELGAWEPQIAATLLAAAARYFSFDREPIADGRPALLIVTGGDGEIDGVTAGRGDTFVVPAACTGFDLVGQLEVLRCMGPST